MKKQSIINKQLLNSKAIRRLMESQWKKGENIPTDEQIGNRIWLQITDKCYEKPKHSILNKKIIRYAAACAALLFIIGTLWYVPTSIVDNTTEYQTFFAREHHLLELPDHSKVWIQPGSTIRYAKTFNEHREIWLKGDATFEVTKQTKHPFRVYIDNAFVEVKGTVFRVANKSHVQSQVTLFNGKVDFHTPIKGQIITMKPNQSITYRPGKKLEIKEINGVKWNNGCYKFNDMPMNSLINMLNDLYNIKIELDSKVPSNHLFTGTIHYNELPSKFIEKICYNMNLKYKQTNNKLIIYKP